MVALCGRGIASFVRGLMTTRTESKAFVTAALRCAHRRGLGWLHRV